MNLSRFILAAIVAGTSIAHADTNTRRFTGTPLSGPYLTVEAARNLGGGIYRFGLMGNFESRPAVFATGDKRVEDIIGSRLTLDAAFALGLNDWMDLGLVLPITLKQSGRQLDSTQALTAHALGDPRIAARAMLIGSEESPFSLATVLETWAPISEGENYAGYGGPGGSGRLNFGYRINSQTQFALNVSYELRPETSFAGLPIDDEIGVGLGTSIRVGPGEILAESKIATDAFAPFAESTSTAGEINGAYRVRLGGQHGLTLGAGLGLLPRLGTPLWRGFLGYSMLGEIEGPQPQRPADGRYAPLGMAPMAPIATMMSPGDLDKDGIENAIDRCPRLAEDVDGFRDHDGCPEPDNDLDNILDIRDQAPTSPEDWDGNGDNDGRPELDNDQDGLADAVDKCPSKAGAGDGCPGSALDWQAELKRQSAEMPRTKALIVGRLILPGDHIHFAPMEEMPATRSLPLLTGLAEHIASHPQLVRVEVGVHTKTGKGETHDLWLSQLRARALTKALADQGVDPIRLFPKGYGSVGRLWTAGAKQKSPRNVVELRALLPFQNVAAEKSISMPEPRQNTQHQAHAGNTDVFQSNSPIKFKPRTAQIRTRSHAAVLELVEFLRSQPKVSAEVAVHTNGLGDKRRMKRLSQTRAKSVVEALVKAGIARERLTSRGYGGSQPKASPKTREGRAANKRVELRWTPPSEGEH